MILPRASTYLNPALLIFKIAKLKIPEVNLSIIFGKLIQNSEGVGLGA